MNSESGKWQRVPVLVRAILTGLLIGVFGALGWSVVYLVTNRLTASLPRAFGPAYLLVGFFYLWGFWRYLGGRGWPRRTREIRSERLRARRLPGVVWAWALSAGVLATISYVALTFVWARLIPLQPWGLAQLSGFSPLALLCLLLGTAVEAGVVEEAAFRGYMQVPLEKRYGPKVAIVIVSVVFGFLHLANPANRELTWVLIYMVIGAIYGTVAYLTNSILPGVVLHAAGDAVRFLVVWRIGPNLPKTLIWQSGPDASFWMSFAVAAIVGVGALWTFRKLALVARPQSPENR